MRLSELNAAPYNPRKIGEKALDGLKYSLEEFGDVSGIVYNTRTGRLVAGHQRVKALQAKFGDLFIDNGTVKAGDEEFKVRFVDWPEAKEKAANVAANSPTISGEFTPDLSTLLDDIKLDMPEAFEAMDFGSMDSLSLADAETGFPDLPSGDKDSLRTATFVLTEEQWIEVERAMKTAKSMGDFVDTGNENSNGNALARVCETFNTQNG